METTEMRLAMDIRTGNWVASGKGYLRPIVSEAETSVEAVAGYKAQYTRQMSEEYAFEQSMSHLSDVATGQPYGSDEG